jgi:hypothetical protein
MSILDFQGGVVEIFFEEGENIFEILYYKTEKIDLYYNYF